MTGRGFFVTCCAIAGCWKVGATPALVDSSGHRVRLVRADAILRDPSVPGVQRWIGDVVMSHRDAEMRCDSAWRFDDGTFRAMGQVVAERPGDWNLHADELVWRPNSEALDAVGNPVLLEDDEWTVEGPKLHYDWTAEVAAFQRRSRLVTPTHLATSDCGLFNADSGWLTLGGDVEVESEQERITSDSLVIQPEEGHLIFRGNSRVWSTSGDWEVACDRGELTEAAGWVASRTGRAWVRRGADGIWADSLSWSDGDGVRRAWGHVEALDTALTQVVRGAFFEQLRVDSVWTSRAEGGVEEAVLIRLDGTDTLRLQAPIFEQSEGVLRAFPGVVFDQGDARGRCDTLFWLEADSTMRFDSDPILWFEDQILTADTVRLTFRSARPHQLIGAGNTHLTHPVNDSCADQITGRHLVGHFHAGELRELWIEGNAEAVYFVEDDDALQFNRALCSRMRIELDEEGVKTIALLDAPSGKFLALEAADPADRWLKGAEVHPVPDRPSLAPWPPLLPPE